MKKIDYSKINSEYLTEEIIAMINTIHEFKGREQVFSNVKKDVLKSLLEVAKIQSIISSNRIEGVFTTDERVKELIFSEKKPKTRNEKEITGYKDVLKLIHENYDSINITPNYLLQLHKILFSYSEEVFGGKYKNVQNYISETDTSGNIKIRFQPVEPYLTETYIEDLCNEYNKYIRNTKYFELILIPIFIVDFLCIHPFNDGNGRMSRILILLLLYQNGFNVGKYISIERIIENTKESYYDSLQDSDESWHENNNTYLPFVKYFLGIIIKAYRELEERIGNIENKIVTKEDRVTAIILSKIGKVTKKDIMEECPDVSMTSIERILSKLNKDNRISKHPNGKKTYYTINWDNIDESSEKRA